MRLRAGELICGAGAVALLAVLFARWTTEQTGSSGWSSLWIGTQLLVDAALIAAVVLVAVVATKRAVAVQVICTVFAVYFGIASLIALAIDVRQLANNSDDFGDVAVRWPAYAAMGFTLLILAGAWRSLSDERLDARASRYTPPDARPLPRS